MLPSRASSVPPALRPPFKADARGDLPGGGGYARTKVVRVCGEERVLHPVVGVPRVGGLRIQVLEMAAIVLNNVPTITAARRNQVGRPRRLVARGEVEAVVHGLRFQAVVGIAFPRPVQELKVVVVGLGRELLPSLSVQRLAVPAALSLLLVRVAALVVLAVRHVVRRRWSVLVPGGQLTVGVRVRVQIGRVVAERRVVLTRVAVQYLLLLQTHSCPPPLLRHSHAATLGDHPRQLELREVLQRGLVAAPVRLHEADLLGAGHQASYAGIVQAGEVNALVTPISSARETRRP